MFKKRLHGLAGLVIAWVAVLSGFSFALLRRLPKPDRVLRDGVLYRVRLNTL